MSVYNGMPYLEEAVKSIINQTYKDFEFIIVNDASTDGTLKYLKSLKDKRIKIINNPKNLGLAASLNKVLLVTNGKYIARMDADDISLPNRLVIQLKYLEEHPPIALCGCWVDLINKEGKVIGEKKYPTSDSQIKNALKWYQPIVHPTFLARSKFYRQLGGYNENFDYAEDYELLVRAIKKYKLANIPQKLLLWRLADDRRSRKSMKKVDIADFKVKLEILKSNYFGKSYAAYVVKKFITTFLLPTSLKVFIAKKLTLA
jgi:GT2 family glycosyltransferase